MGRGAGLGGAVAGWLLAGSPLAGRPLAGWPLAGWLLAATLGCGGPDAPPRAGPLTVAISVLRHGRPAPCGSVPAIERLSLALVDQTGGAAVAGFPAEATCATATITATVAPGAYLLDVSAEGPVGGRQTVLFSSETPIASGDHTVAAVLAPQVALLSVGWSFQDQALMPCLYEVDHLTVRVASLAGADLFSASPPCTSSPLLLAPPFALDDLQVTVEALSPAGVPIFSATALRTPERGDQEYDLTLTPLGGALQLDFDFLVGGRSIRACDDPAVQVDRLQASVRPAGNGSGNGAGVAETFDCDAPRPYEFRAARYRPGTLLQLDLVGVGASRFAGRSVFVMPDGDRRWVPPLPLSVASATISGS